MSRPIDPILEQLIAAGQAELVAKLRSLDDGSPAQRAIVEAIAAGLEAHGVAELAKIASDIGSLIKGTDAVVLDVGDLRASSKLLAAMQRLEADQRSEAAAVVARVVNVIGPIVGALLRLAIAPPK